MDFFFKSRRAPFKLVTTSGSSGSYPEGKNCDFLWDPEVIKNFKDDKQISILWKEPQNADAKGNADDKGKVDVKGKHVVNEIVNVDFMGNIDDIGRSDHDVDVKAMLLLI